MRALLAVVVLAGCYDPARPPPRASSLSESLAIPSDHDLALEIEDALIKKRRGDVERAIEAREPGEQLEHARLSQTALDRDVFTLDDLFRRGDDLFAYSFRPEDGLGNALADHAGIPAGPLPRPNLRRVHQGEFGGPDAMACADCHSVGGDDGAGTATQVTAFRGDGDSTHTADLRNPPAVLGLGPIERLAAEMTGELAGQRTAALAMASTLGSDATIALRAKGVDFGMLTARPDGTVDTSQVAGVDADLVIKPFGWKGTSTTIREFVTEAAALHFGIQGEDAALANPADPLILGDGPPEDRDGDGIADELTAGQLTSLAVYVAALETPVMRPHERPVDLALPQGPTEPFLVDEWVRGRALFEQVGCASCHRPSLVLDRPVVAIESPRTGKVFELDLARDGEAPRLTPDGEGYPVWLFSDLKRHDLGDANASTHLQGGIATKFYLTRRLWGLAGSPPYFYDGQATTVDHAVARHGGEAAAARDAWNALALDDRSALRIFLTSLRREPRLVVP